MKKCFILFALVSGLFLSGNAQNYQLLNPGFEEWESSNISAEPVHWNSFATSDGAMAMLASTPHHYHRNGGRPGTEGSSFLTIYSTAIIGIVANGNMTTGRIHAAEASATSPNNYNYTMRSDGDFSQAFTATPDSMYIWVSFFASDESTQASISAFLHGNCDFRDPSDKNDPSKYAAQAVAHFSRTTSSRNMYSWQQIKVPFVYDGETEPAYILMSLTTNMNPGAGAAYDSLSIDDIQFIYSSWLSDIKLNGATLDGFAKDRMHYDVTFASVEAMNAAQFQFVPEVADAQVNVNPTSADSSVSYEVSVVAEDGTSRTYTIDCTVGTVGIREAANNAIAVYPNPATSIVVVRSDNMRHLTLCNLKGQVVMQRDFTTPVSSCELDVATMPKGVYALTIDGNSTKLVVE